MRKVLSRMSPQILILDVMLPDGLGTELLADIRAEGRAMTVAVVTAVTDPVELAEITALKVDAIFGKPMDIDDFDHWLVKQLANFAMDAARNPPRNRSVPRQPQHKRQPANKTHASPNSDRKAAFNALKVAILLDDASRRRPMIATMAETPPKGHVPTPPAPPAYGCGG